MVLLKNNMARLMQLPAAVPHPMQKDIQRAVDEYELFRGTLMEEAMLQQLESVVRKAGTVAPLDHSKTPFRY